MGRRFLSDAQRAQLEAAVAAAERGTSAEIRVRLQPRGGGDPRAAAERAFVRLGMTRTAARNGALIFVAWRDRAFAVIGDRAIHERVGDEFWRATADAMAARFVADDFVGGIAAGVAALGEVLARHFPRAADDVNELPDEISED